MCLCLSAFQCLRRSLRHGINTDVPQELLLYRRRLEFSHIASTRLYLNSGWVPPSLSQFRYGSGLLHGTFEQKYAGLEVVILYYYHKS